MKLTLGLLAAVMLSACGGGSGSFDDQSNVKFSTDDLIGKAFLSKSLLDTRLLTTDDVASISLFKSDSLREIELAKAEVIYNGTIETTENESEYSDLPWELSDGVLEVTYPDNGTCLTSKLDDRTSEVDIKGVCTDSTDGSVFEEKETVIRPLTLDKSTFHGMDITLIDEGVYEHFKFNSDNSFEYFETIDPDSTNTVMIGRLNDSDYENTVRVDFPDNNNIYNTPDYGLLMSLTAGSLVFITFNDNDALHNIRFIEGVGSNNWFVSDYFLGPFIPGF